MNKLLILAALFGVIYTAEVTVLRESNFFSSYIISDVGGGLNFLSASKDCDQTFIERAIKDDGSGDHMFYFAKVTPEPGVY